MVIINATLFLFSWTTLLLKLPWDYEIFFIMVILWASCNEIESNIVNCQNVYLGEKRMKKKIKTKTQNEKIVQADMDIWH